MAKKPKQAAALPPDDSGAPFGTDVVDHDPHTGADPGAHPMEEDEELRVSDAVQIAADTLTGDLRSFILGRLQYEQDRRPWSERSEQSQRDTIAAVEAAVNEAVRKGVEIIASHGRQVVRAVVDTVQIKDGMKITLTAARSSRYRNAIIDAVGNTVMVVVADPDAFTGEREPVVVTPDQGDIETAIAGVVHSNPDDNREPLH